MPQESKPPEMPITRWCREFLLHPQRAVELAPWWLVALSAAVITAGAVINLRSEQFVLKVVGAVALLGAASCLREAVRRRGGPPSTGR